MSDVHPLKNVIRRTLPHFAPRTVFDVGANIGQSTAALLDLFPGATIHSFEPAPSSFAKLSETYGPVADGDVIARTTPVVLHRLAVGDRDAQVAIMDSPQSVMNKILPDGSPNVRMTRLDTFCGENEIGQIDYLKIDTEGLDFQVLQGCGHVLGRSISMVECEVSANRYNRYHSPFEDVSQYLYDRGYALFHIFEQMMEFQAGGLPILRRFNAAFINLDLVGDLDRVGVR